MKNLQKGFSRVTAVIIVALVVIGSGAIYFYGHQLITLATGSSGDASVLATLFSSRPTDISACQQITKSGRYTLKKDIKAFGNGCLSIENTSNIDLDCKGNSIILDQQNQPNTEEVKPLLGLKNVKNFSITSCNFRIINPSFVSSDVVIEDSSDGTISDSTFYNPDVISDGVDLFPIFFRRTSNIKFGKNIVYGVFQQNYSSNNVIEKNTFSPTLKTLKTIQVPVGSSNGGHNIIRNNIIDGRWGGSGQTSDIGADDGIEISDESYDTIDRNKISNNWDCGIETTGLIENVTISNNTISSSGICGIGAWYDTSWKGNVVTNNVIDRAPKMFFFFRQGVLRPQESAVYFTDNIFLGNSFINPTQDISAVFSFQNASCGEKGCGSIIPYVTHNNRFTNNNFNSLLRAPGFFPPSMVIDGGGNICGAPATGDYPNISDFPLKCKKK